MHNAKSLISLFLSLVSNLFLSKMYLFSSASGVSRIKLFTPQNGSLKKNLTVSQSGY